MAIPRDTSTLFSSPFAHAPPAVSHALMAFKKTNKTGGGPSGSIDGGGASMHVNATGTHPYPHPLTLPLSLPPPSDATSTPTPTL